MVYTASENAQHSHDTGLTTTNEKPIIKYDK